MTGPRIGPRIGPNPGPDSDWTIWARHIHGRTWLFMAGPNGVSTRPTEGPGAYQPTHFFTKEN
jgi:hypothetical protein